MFRERFYVPQPVPKTTPQNLHHTKHEQATNAKLHVPHLRCCTLLYICTPRCARLPEMERRVDPISPTRRSRTDSSDPLFPYAGCPSSDDEQTTPPTPLDPRMQRQRPPRRRHVSRETGPSVCRRTSPPSHGPNLRRDPRTGRRRQCPETAPTDSIKRRTNVAGIFPNEAAIVRLLRTSPASYLRSVTERFNLQ